LSKATQFGKEFNPVVKAENLRADDPTVKNPVTTFVLSCTPTVTD
jgi:hypothetical protein